MVKQQVVTIIPIDKIERSTFQCRESAGDFTELSLSIEKHGVIEPIIVRAKNGRYELVAGDRRVKASKAAGLKEIPALLRELSDEQAFIFQASENLQRKDLTEPEKTNLVTYCAEHYKWTPKEIATNLSMSYSWVAKYLPDEFKDQAKAEAGAQGGFAKVEAATRRVAELKSTNVGLEQTIRPLSSIPTPKETIECERCHIHVSKENIKPWHGHNLCDNCEQKATLNPEVFERYFGYLAKSKKGEAPAQLKPPTFKEKWEETKAHMTPQHSKAEEKIVEKLRAKGYNVETGIKICLISTEPDFNVSLPNQKHVHGYIDGPVHNGKRMDRDEELRELLQRRFPDDLIITVQVKGDSDKEISEKVAEIEEMLKW